MNPDSVAEPVPPPPRWTDAGLALVAGAAVGGAMLFFGLPAQALNFPLGIWVAEAGVFLGVSWLVVRLSGRDPAAYTGLRLTSAWPLLFGLVAGVANFCALVVPIQALVQSGLDALIHSQAPAGLRNGLAHLREAFDSARLLKEQRGLELAVIGAGVALAAPFCEEFFFRGVIQRGLTRRRLVPGLLLASLVFAGAHLDPLNGLALFEVGLFLGALYARTGSIWPGVMAHAANNGVSLVLFLAGGEAKPDELPDPTMVLGLSAIGGMALLGLLLFARRFPVLLTGEPVKPVEGVEEVERV